MVGQVGDERMDDGRAVRIDDALGPPGRARGVAHRDRVIFLVRHVVEFFRRRREQLLVIEHGCRHWLPGQRHDDDFLERHLGAELRQQRQQYVVDDEKTVLGVIGNVGDVVRREPQIERVHDAARRGNAEVAFEVRVVIP